ncbi:hypothetical protein [Cytobacillus solani]|uniref:hypothetical protein n=2 Tax=Cytobacillus solani TaxID=1637975 RepID=UPI0012E119D5|nr:hypothetical protein [Cytobacillus solani]
MMKVYLVEINNYESFEDYRAWIEKAFTTYRAASQWLIEDGFEVYPLYNYKGEWELDFYWQESNEYMADCRGAGIIEIELYEQTS